jgi:hypothetical protein
MTDLTLLQELPMQEMMGSLSGRSIASRKSQARNERNDRTEVFSDDDETNLSYLSYPDTPLSTSSKLSGFSSVLRE